MFSAKPRFSRRERTSPLPLLKPVRQPRPPVDPGICPNCHAVRRKGTWTLEPAVCREVARWKHPVVLLCPRCRVAHQAAPSGFLHLTGSYLRVHGAEILQLLRKAEQEAARRNPLERIVRIRDDSPSELVVETTSDRLAQRMGRAIARAFRGTLRIRFSHQDKLVRLYWHREAAGVSA